MSVELHSIGPSSHKNKQSPKQRNTDNKTREVSVNRSPHQVSIIVQGYTDSKHDNNEIKALALPVALDSSDDDNTSLDDAFIVVNNVHKTYLLGVEGVPALRGVTLTVKRGEFIVILGKSGSGKTSLLNIIGTIDKPTKGYIKIANIRLSSHTKDKDVAFLRLNRIGFVFQTFNLISSMTAQQNVELPMLLQGRLTKAQMRDRAIELLSRVGMKPRLDHIPAQLSGGEQQRVTIARAIANRPSILLLDEPTGDLDTKNSNIIMNLLLELNRKQKITCIMVTHDVEMRQYAHRVVHMLDGKIRRLEIVSPKTRAEADAKLHLALEPDVQGPKLVKAPVTEFREPRDVYRFIALGKKKKRRPKY